MSIFQFKIRDLFIIVLLSSLVIQYWRIMWYGIIMIMWLSIPDNLGWITEFRDAFTLRTVQD